MKIFGWLADIAGCGWYRIMLPLGALNEAGLAQTSFGPKLSIETALAQDVVIAQRTYMPEPTAVWRNIARQPNRPLMVLELDDDLFHVEPDNPSAGTFNSKGTQTRLRHNIEVADLVTVSTEPLAEVVRPINPNVVVLPNCIPQDLLKWDRGMFRDRLTVGWQGSPTHNADWATAAEPIRRWFAGHAGRLLPLEMHTIGALPDTFPKIARHRHTPWLRDIPQLYRLIDWRIALAPLRDTVFNRSKSDLRVLEAAMLGIPTVASDVPAYRTFPDGVAGVRVSRPGQWREALEVLSDRDVARTEMGKTARDWAATRTIEGNAPRWLAAYEKARTG